MKFYVHCENPEVTMVIRWENLNGTLTELEQTVRGNFQRKFPERFGSSSDVELVFKIRGKQLNSDDVVTKKIKNMDDVDVVLQPVSETAQKSASTDKASTEKVKEYLSLASNLVEKQRIRRAILLYEDVVRLDTRNVTAYLGIIDCYLKAKRPHKALHYLKKLQQLKITDVNRELQYRFGQCYISLGDADKAVEILQKYCVDLRKTGGSSTAHKHQIQVLLAKAYLLKDEKDMALVILQGILREDQTCIEALTEYASLIYPLGPAQGEEAMTVLLTLIANNRNDNYIKEKFSWACQQPNSLKMLESVAGKAWSDIASLVFIATSIRECGAIKEALTIMEHAYDLKHSEAHTLLTYVHMLELTEQHGDGVRLIKQYIEENPDLTVGNFMCGNLQPITKFLSADSFFSNLEKEFQHPAPTRPNTTEDYNDDERYLLALLFTLVKILYIKGCLDLVKYLTEILDPLTEDRDLHQTNIRNESAYFTCISKVMKTCPNLHIAKGDNKFLYFIGDSHCITPAWQQIQFKNEQYTIYPVLSTGTKIWHLRKESKFYPKINFYNAIKVIPSQASVVLCFGEIDCREAFLLCIEKAKYDSLDEVMDAVIDIYLDVIKDLHDKYSWEIYVHPVMPVLDITRSIVIQFNASLKRRIQKEKWLKWLEFVDELTHQKENQNIVLKDEYKFDGTHVHPCYTSLLQTSLTNV